MSWTGQDALGRPKDKVTHVARTRIYYVKRTGDLKYGQRRTRKYTSAKDAAFEAASLARRDLLAAVAYQDMNPIVQQGLPQLLKDAGLKKLEDALG